MKRWVGRVAVVTGASAGIGAAIAQELVDHGMTVVAVARRVDKIEEAVAQARKEVETRGRAHEKTTPGKLHSRQCDVSKEEDILATFKWVEDNLGGVDVLVNNAGIVGATTLTETNTAEWKRILDVNVLGLSICTREAIKSMRERGVDDGHVIHIGSISGHDIQNMSSLFFYASSKHAVRALTEGLRKDLAASKSKIKISCISPGVVKTEIFDPIANVDPEKFYQDNAPLNSSDIADAVLYSLGTPPHVQIHDLIILPLGQNM